MGCPPLSSFCWEAPGGRKVAEAIPAAIRASGMLRNSSRHTGMTALAGTSFEGRPSSSRFFRERRAVSSSSVWARSMAIPFRHSGFRTKAVTLASNRRAADWDAAPLAPWNVRARRSGSLAMITSGRDRTST